MTAGIEREGLFPATCPYDVDKPSVTVGWRSVGFVHWAYDPDVVSRLLPSDVSLDLYGGRAWAGYQFATVGFGGVTGDQPPRWARLRLERHEVRAVVAVIDRVNLPGVWYLSVDTDRRLVAAGLRRWLNLPAYEAESRFSALGDRFEYWTQRPDGTTARLKLTVGREIEPTDVDRFLTARWRIVQPPRWWDPADVVRAVLATHEPWILHRASVEFFDDDMLVAAGLPPAVGGAQALWSPGTTLEIGPARNDGQRRRTARSGRRLRRRL